MLHRSRVGGMRYPKLSVLLVLACLGLLSCGHAGAAEKTTAVQPVPGDEKKSPDTALPLKRVVLFSSGVGFFEHSGTVQGNARVEMNFKTEGINDLLKSMVVQDLDGGQVSAVGYGSKDPIDKTLKSFAIDLTANPTLGKLLAQVRGEKVEIDAPNKITGIILGVESRKIEIDKGRILETESLNLLTDDGLRSVSLETVSRIKLANEKLDAELRKALAVLASSHATDKKAVTLSFLGEGARKVRVGYVQETPVWKTSYRLVLDEQKPALLQGWAIVENTTEEDWSGVGLTLVSGRPISFVMDLYQPLYVSRPMVEMELYASLRPQVYGQDMAARDAEFRKRAEPAAAAPAPAGVAGMGGGMGGTGFGAAPARGRRALSEKQKSAEEADKDAEQAFNFRQGVRSVAAAGNVGELFQYKIDTPVTLSRRQSAMLPIVGSDVKAEKLSIYNPTVHAKHPLNGLKLNNSTELHLMQGPITVFDGGAYAGDAKIEDLAPGSQRLLSYAMDLETEVAPESKGRPQELIRVRLAKGTALTEWKHVRTQEYTIKNSGRKPKKVLIEQPFDPTWTLVTPKEPTEKTRDLYRFAVDAKPGTPAKLTVEEERIDRQQVAITNLDDGAIQMYLGQKVVSDQVKTALAEIVKRKAALQEVSAKRAQLEQQIKAVEEEQNRIRQNMDRLDRTSELYKRYVKKFTDQEDDVEKLRTQIRELTSQETQLRKAMDEYLMGLDLQ